MPGGVSNDRASGNWELPESDSSKKENQRPIDAKVNSKAFEIFNTSKADQRTRVIKPNNAADKAGNLKSVERPSNLGGKYKLSFEKRREIMSQIKKENRDINFMNLSNDEFETLIGAFHAYDTNKDSDNRLQAQLKQNLDEQLTFLKKQYPK